ncbi:Carboxypeptidase [Caenorhabditis elegans]|uniref:Carboxypeptidase n=1 Tax=Caenorhabditis elegans TaxID=6239 RepID=O76725_CAEEL|nr:Carboxypeptidase [Caenorhabditis elegans]CCD64385.1 Carboxypeptidase [Caenorhabditis elegans]|eukprot:NP_498460.1 Carboxypeptidase [Caenorhabditis elegans]
MILLLFITLFALGSTAPADQQITSLPNLTEPLRSKHYAGYLSISDVKQLFYWYVESEESPETAPVVLWLNGGPGCASMEGLFIEMGPFRVRNYGEEVNRNPWTWNRIANIIYLDAPAGVGFSYYNTTKKVFTDDEVAQDNFNALKMWFARFPERKTNDFYIAGESYGGTYVPMLSARITKANVDFPQFKGMLVGNGCVDDQINFNTNIMYQYYHAVVDETQMQNVTQQCCNGTMDCDYYTISQGNDTCGDLVNQLSYSIYYTGYDPYFLYFACYLNPNLPYPPHEEIRKLQKNVLRNNLYKKIIGESPVLKNKYFYPPSNDIQGQPDCASHDDHFPYLNSPEVKKALRIPDYVPKYEMCNMEIAENYQSQYPTMKKFFDTVIDAKKHVAMFNGDADTLCNYVENSQFIYKTLKKTVKTAMMPWNDPVQLPMAVGQVTEYDGITLISIKGGGHFPAATEQKPKETFQMFQNYVKHQNYSTPVAFDKTFNLTSTIIAVGSKLFLSFCISIILFL